MEHFTKKHKFAAWLVHYFTITGVVWASLAILALYQNNIKMMWLWLAIALFVDAIDGTFARKFRVKDVLPTFDGSTLDMVVDYLTWTFIPALFMYLYIPFSPYYETQWLPLTMFFIIGVSSVFCYCNVNMKASDYYFVGFPAAWNIVALYFYILNTNWIVNVTVTIILSILTISNLKFVHPFRVKKFMSLNILFTFLWLLASACLVAEIRSFHTAAFSLFIISSLWLFAVSAIRTIQGAK